MRLCKAVGVLDVRCKGEAKLSCNALLRVRGGARMVWSAGLRRRGQTTGYTFTLVVLIV
ncbi:MAG: hypothetical protein M3437_08275 [Chloroflexota bacterium]|nr:hypothetical protein [Chloroflexota bacterium]MDQ5865969.1 hypothetical protein [Chloroflexota bacterium]